MKNNLAILLGLYAITSAANADEGFPDVRIGGLVDARLAFTSGTQSWFDKGLGKTRYGGSDGDDRIIGRIAQGSLLVLPQFNWSWSGTLHLKYDQEQRHPIDIVEGYLSYRPVSTSANRLSARFGAFIPPVSFENIGLAWTSPYTLTPSAINTWIGEEVKTVGGEVTWLHVGEENRTAFTGALFKGNDPAGSLLAWRGWSMHDHTSTLFDRLPLTRTVQTDFPRQAPWVEPFREIDGRFGYYAAVTWEQADFIKFRLLHYDNRADQTAFDGTQYAWHTHFNSAGVQLELPDNFEFISQYMFGNTAMGMLPNIIDVDFPAYFALLSKTYGKQRFTLRYDHFAVHDNVEDEYNESGHAWTLAYSIETTKNQHLILETLRIDSTREQRTSLGLPTTADELLTQVNYRITF